MKILFYGESGLNPTGFGQVNKHLLAACARVGAVTHVATTHYREEYDREAYPYEIIGCPLVPVEERSPEHQRNLGNIEKAVKSLDWDVFFYQGDMGWNNDVLEWVKVIQEEHPEKNSIFYMPIDGDIAIGATFAPLTWCSAPAVYTNHAKSVVSKYAPEVAKNLSVMWLGTEPDVFYPLSAAEKRAARIKLFGEQYLNRFLVLNVNRNQVRKDLARSMAAFHLFHVQHPDSSLYMHSVQNDIGGSLPVQAMMAGCDVFAQPAEIIFSGLDLANPWSRASLNELYNACDCLISTAYGEGWGLATSEAMCAGLPVVVPGNTANLDIVGENDERGWLVKTGGDLDHTTFLYNFGASVVSVIHTDSFLEKLAYVKLHPEEAREKAQVARAWCEQHAWDRRESEWEQLLLMIKDLSEQTLQTTTTC